MIGLLLITFSIGLILGIPIIISIGIATYFALLKETTIPLVLLSKSIYTATDQFPFHAVPLFILAGALMEESGMSEQVVDVMEKTVGRIRGGLAIATVLGCMFFASMSGSGPATAAAIGFIVIPSMVSRGYAKDFSAALSSSAGTLGILIPPSNPMIVYGVIGQASIVGLFIAGIIPGLFVTTVLMLIAYWICRQREYGRKVLEVSAADLLLTCWRSKWALFTPVLILGGIYGGIFTPVEGSVVAVLYSLMVGALITKKLTSKKIYDCLSRTCLISGSNIILVGLSTAFGELLTLAQAPQKIASLLSTISDDWRIIYLLIIAFLIVLGTFMDTMATIIILTPILLPVMVQLGIHPIHFGIIFVVTNEIAFLTPPVGANLFAMTAVTGLPLERIAREEIPFIVGLIGAVIILALVPEISLFLPRITGYLY
jgi:C4-dicarboxylate transporter DctM subunit